MKERYLENDYAEIWFENGIVHIVYKPGCVLNINNIKLIVEGRLKVSAGTKGPILIDLRNVVSSDNATRSYLATPEAEKYLSAGAMLITNEIQRLLMNLYFKIDKPNLPARVFTNREKALEWLEQFKYLN
jgi:hypothetical protein